MIRRVGLDLDNTIIDYDSVFLEAAKRFGHEGSLRSKSEVRDLVRATSGDESWQRIQGWVYSEGIRGARPFWGVHEFLRRCANRGIDVFLVSHKTRHGHFASTDVLLRGVALDWLLREGLCGPASPAIRPERVHFCDDRSDKIRRITELEVDVFVDDLLEVLTDAEFPDRTRRIGFRIDGPVDGIDCVRSWREVGDCIFGVSEPEEAVAMAVVEAQLGTIERVAPVTMGGNSQSFDVRTNWGRYFVKRYPDRQHDQRPRCETESSALRWMNQRGLPVPSLLWADGSLGMAVHGFVSGSSVDQPSMTDVDRAADFVKRLADHSQEEHPEFGNASEHFGSASDLIGQVERRIELGERSNFPPCARYFRSELRPAFEHEQSHLRSVMVDTLEGSSPLESRTLSPSDFGFHNSLRTGGGIVFVDFEYFGWDDPAKLVADFLLHPGFKTSKETQSKWIARSASTFGPEVVHRALTMLPLVAIRWEAIIMKPFVDPQKVFDHDEWLRRRERAEMVRTIALEWRR